MVFESMESFRNPFFALHFVDTEEPISANESLSNGSIPNTSAVTSSHSNHATSSTGGGGGTTHSSAATCHNNQSNGTLANSSKNLQKNPENTGVSVTSGGGLASNYGSQRSNRSHGTHESVSASSATTAGGALATSSHSASTKSSRNYEKLQNNHNVDVLMEQNQASFQLIENSLPSSSIATVTNAQTKRHVVVGQSDAFAFDVNDLMENEKNSWKNCLQQQQQQQAGSKQQNNIHQNKSHRGSTSGGGVSSTNSAKDTNHTATVTSSTSSKKNKSNNTASGHNNSSHHRDDSAIR